jgi:hypothetical protein
VSLGTGCLDLPRSMLNLVLASPETVAMAAVHFTTVTVLVIALPAHGTPDSATLHRFLWTSGSRSAFILT